MAAAPNPPLITVEEYLTTSYPDGDREYVDGVVVERNVGTQDHSRLQKFVIGHLVPYELSLGLEVLPECRTRLAETHYRIPDIAVMRHPFRRGRVLVDVPFIVIEVLSPDDRMGPTIRRLREYEKLGVPHIIQMDPEDRTTFILTDGNLVQRHLKQIEVPPHGVLPFDTRALLAQLDRQITPAADAVDPQS